MPLVLGGGIRFWQHCEFCVSHTVDMAHGILDKVLHESCQERGKVESTWKEAVKILHKPDVKRAPTRLLIFSGILEDILSMILVNISPSLSWSTLKIGRSIMSASSVVMKLWISSRTSKAVERQRNNEAPFIESAHANGCVSPVQWWPALSTGKYSNLRF